MTPAAGPADRRAERCRRARQAGRLVSWPIPAAGPGDLLAAVVALLGADNPPSVHRRRARPCAGPAGPAADARPRRPAARPGHPDRHGTARRSGDPDVIVTQLPYQPGEARDLVAVLDVVDDVAVRLSPGRFAVVLGPAAALADELPPYSAAARARADLLTGDVVEAVIRLPGGLRSVPARLRDRAVGADPGRATPVAGTRAARRRLRPGAYPRRDQRPRGGRGHLAAGRLPAGGAPPPFGAAVAVRNLIDPPRPLDGQPPAGEPRERAGGRATQRVTAITRYGVELDRIGATATAVRRHVRTEALAAADRASRPPRPSVALAPGKPAHSSQGHQDQAGSTSPRPVTMSSSARKRCSASAGRASAGSTARCSPGLPDARLTEPGDVLVTMSPRPGAMIDQDGLSIAEFPVRILRIPAAEAEQFTPRVLAALLFADGSGTRAAGAVRGSPPGGPASAPAAARPRSAASTASRRDRSPPRPRPGGNSTCSTNCRRPPSAASSMEH